MTLLSSVELLKLPLKSTLDDDGKARGSGADLPRLFEPPCVVDIGGSATEKDTEGVEVGVGWACDGATDCGDAAAATCRACCDFQTLDARRPSAGGADRSGYWRAEPR